MWERVDEVTLCECLGEVGALVLVWLSGVYVSLFYLLTFFKFHLV